MGVWGFKAPGLPTFHPPHLSNLDAMRVICPSGVMISAWGEAHLVVMGLVCILVAIVADAVRLTLSQKLLQQVIGWHTDLVFLSPVRRRWQGR